MQPETVKFLELWFLRIVSTGVGVIGVSYLNGNWIEWASWIAVPLFRNTMLLVVTWMLLGWLSSSLGHTCTCNSHRLSFIFCSFQSYVQVQVLEVLLFHYLQGSFVVKQQPIKTSHFWRCIWVHWNFRGVLFSHESAFNVNGLIKWK